jgi:hypothetical protein
LSKVNNGTSEFTDDTVWAKPNKGLSTKMSKNILIDVLRLV